MKNLLLITTFLLSLSSLHAQSDQKNTQWMQYVEELAESEDVEESAIEQLFEELSYLSENPYNLHTVSKTELEQLPFLSDLQIENLLYYLYRYAPLTSIYELKNVDEMDTQTISYLLPFVYIGEEKGKKEFQPRNLIRYGKQDLLLRSDYCFQEKAGYKKATDEEKKENPNHSYLGENYYLSFKYGYEYKDFLQFGICGEKDAGEAFWNKNKRGFDYYSINLVIKNRGILHGLYVGDYRLSFGQGLVLNTNFSMGKTSDVTNISQKSGGVKRHFSTSESGFFRGFAGTLKIDHTQLSFFYSHRQQDANADSSYIYTFKTDGFNRTVNDIEKRKQSTVNLYGTHIRWDNEWLSLGTTAAYYSFGGKELNPETKPYNLFHLRGKSNFNAGVNYTIHRKKYALQGEMGLSQNGGMATINTIHMNPASFIDLVFSYRNFTRDYQSLYARTFSESSTVQNESGFYTGIKFRLDRRWEIATSFDYFRFPWLRYGINAPSYGSDALIQLSYIPFRNLTMGIRYKFKEKHANSPSEKSMQTLILPYEQHKWRYQAAFHSEKGFNFRTQLDYNLYKATGQQQSGWLISQAFGFASKRFPIQIDCALAYFQTKDWNTRISIYEKNILYTFSFPPYYGNGLRYYAVLKLKISSSLTLYLKASSTQYFDREIIGSGLEEVLEKKISTIYCLFRYKF